MKILCCFTSKSKDHNAVFISKPSNVTMIMTKKLFVVLFIKSLAIFVMHTNVSSLLKKSSISVDKIINGQIYQQT